MTTLPVADARANFSKLIESAATTHERFEITRNGDRVAVLLSSEDFDSMQETLDILSDPAEVQAIREGVADLKTRRTFSIDDVAAEMRERGRL
jgi:antitoxin YefM